MKNFAILILLTMLTSFTTNNDNNFIKKYVTEECQEISNQQESLVVAVKYRNGVNNQIKNIIKRTYRIQGLLFEDSECSLTEETWIIYNPDDVSAPGLPSPPENDPIIVLHANPLITSFSFYQECSIPDNNPPVNNNPTF